MSIVTITLNNKNFQLFCNDGSEEQLHHLVAQVNEQIAEIKSVNSSASYELLLVMTVLSLQNQIQTLSLKLNTSKDEKNQEENEQFSETLSTIASYLENLAKKIGK